MKRKWEKELRGREREDHHFEIGLYRIGFESKKIPNLLHGFSLSVSLCLFFPSLIICFSFCSIHSTLILKLPFSFSVLSSGGFSLSLSPYPSIPFFHCLSSFTVNSCKHTAHAHCFFIWFITRFITNFFFTFKSVFLVGYFKGYLNVRPRQR